MEGSIPSGLPCAASRWAGQQGPGISVSIIQTEWCVIGPSAGFHDNSRLHQELARTLCRRIRKPACIFMTRSITRKTRIQPGRRLWWRQGSTTAGSSEHRREAEAARHPDDAAGRPWVGTSVPAGVAEKGPRSLLFVERGRSHDSKMFHFVTYTLSYPYCDWLTLLELEQHYIRTSVDAAVTTEGYDIKTKNVGAFAVGIHPTLAGNAKIVVRLDGQTLEVELSKIKNDGYRFRKQTGEWKDGFEPPTQSILTPGSKRGSDFDFGTIRFEERCAIARTNRRCVRTNLFASRDPASANPCYSSIHRRYAGTISCEWAMGFRGDLPIMTE